jgi:hypothetical protein
MTRHEDLLKQVTGILVTLEKEDVVGFFENILGEMSEDRLLNILIDLKEQISN